MKLIKATGLGITKDHKGILLQITSEGIAVSDEVASELQIELGHTIEVSDISDGTEVPTPADVVPEPAPEVTPEPTPEVTPETVTGTPTTPTVDTEVTSS